MQRIRFIIFLFKNEKLNYKLLKILKKYNIRFTVLNFGKTIKSDKFKIINYKSKDLKELFIRILSQKEEICFFLYNYFNSYKEIFYLIKKTKWFFKKYNYNAGILDFNLNVSKYFYFRDSLNYESYKFYGLENIKCPDPRCFAFRKDILSNFMDFEISTKNFGRGFEIFLSFFCYCSNKKYVCRDISRKINLKFDLKKFRTLLDVSNKNPKHDKKLNIFIESLSSTVLFNMEYFKEIYFSKGPKKLIEVLFPILNKTFIKNNKNEAKDFILDDKVSITNEIKLYEA